MSNPGTLHHIEIYVSDLKKSTEFWGWFLGHFGYELYQEWNEGKSYRLGDTYLVFVQTEEDYKDIPYHRKRVGLNHLAFHGKSRKHIDEITLLLKVKGVNILYSDQYPNPNTEGNYVIYFEDPDRIKVEVVAPE